ncbi:5-formyltetrahydrofolate cyclo-ligase [Oceanithermus sp.]
MKQDLRKRLLERRNAFDTAYLSAAAARHLAGFLREQDAREVLLYLPFRGELSPLELLELYPEARYHLPRTAPDGLTVHPFASPREHHPYGFEQPAANAPRADPRRLDAVVVPGLAFDRAGYRLGYGGGYYDRFLPTLPETTLRIGLAPAALVLEHLPRDPWDARVDWLVSEAGILRTIDPDDQVKLGP